MNAIQPSKPPLQPRETRQVAKRQKNSRLRLNRHPYKAVAIENSAKLVANIVISALALYGLSRLLPNFWTGEQKLQEISTEVKQTEGRVNDLRQDFDLYFDSRQANTLMQEQSTLFEPGTKQVFWQKKSPK
jgi:outer membrane murein-binding lipoprotein Lpp